MCRDLSGVTGSELLIAAGILPKKQAVDVVIGGPPCQGFSVGGQRRAEDERNNQLLNFARLVAEIRPKAFLLENVRGLLEPRFDELRDLAFNVLTGAGYTLSGTDTVVDASQFGVPQRRKRVIVIGTLHGPAVDLKGTRRMVSVGDALEGLPNPSNYPALRKTDCSQLTSLDSAALMQVCGDYARALVDGAYPSAGRGAAMLTNSLLTQHKPDVVDRFAATPEGAVEPKSRLYRLNRTSVARTLRAGTSSERGAHTSPRPIHPTEARVITVREAARLQGFPDWFRFNPTNWHGHRQVGNSVPPPVARAAANAIARAIDVRLVPGRWAIDTEREHVAIGRLEAAALLGADLTGIPRARVSTSRQGALPEQSAR